MLLIKTYLSETGQFIKKRGSMDSQFHMAGEPSQSWQKLKEKQRHILHGSRQESLCRGAPIYKTIRSHETYSLQEQYGGNHSHDSIVSDWPQPQHMGIITIQGKIWVGTQPNHIIPPLAPPKSHVLIFQNQSCLPNSALKF
uniref:Uncharacterized protein n=1 Tax=Macaca fascicularis TaxID=9541 RepID=A0A7N9CC36_MACFA